MGFFSIVIKFYVIVNGQDKLKFLFKCIYIVTKGLKRIN